MLEREEMIPSFFHPVFGVTYDDPQPTIAGEASVWLDRRGHLTYLEVLPPEVDKSAGTPQTPDWSILFREAGFDPAKWTAADPIWTPCGYADTRAAWKGVLPGRPEIAMRIEAAAYRGKPTFWRLIGPWGGIPSRASSGPPSIGQKITDIIAVSIMAALMIGGALIARRNLRKGIGDRRGAGRLASLTFGLMALVWIFSEHHVPTIHEFYLFSLFAGSALLISVQLWFWYIALEPLIRRRWPMSLTSWSRLLSGRFRDALVGRDLLIGCVVGVIYVLLDHLSFLIPDWIGAPHAAPYASRTEVFVGARALIPIACSAPVRATEFGLLILFILFLLRVLLRKQWAATLVFLAFFAAMGALDSESPILGGILGALEWALPLLVVLRFGLLATTTGIFAYNILSWFPLTMQLSAWYSGMGLLGAGLVLILSLVAFRTSLSDRPLFGRSLLED